MGDFKRTAVVTGGSSGIGRAVVTRFLQEGYRVAFLGATEERVSRTLAELRARFGEAPLLGEVVDLRDTTRIGEFFARARAHFGDAAVLVNSAGISPKEQGVRIPTHTLPVAQFNEVIAVNLTAALLCAQQLLPAMMTHGYGRIVLVGSIAARSLPRFAGSAYVASKAGLAGLGRSLAAEYGDRGITTNTVSPGNVATAMTGGADSPQNRRALENIPVGRLGSPEDFPGLVSFLCSEEAGFINGATLDVTGGEFVPA